ncbi:MAG: hypothetical protein IPK34_09010 [Ramlibacter sp.]|jgi:two-component system heavy metal sensor histidine kinase CusS|nr:hypothetical protein [Ramlibacter sp.]
MTMPTETPDSPRRPIDEALADAGQPVSTLVLPRLFDRFFRIQTSREGGSENHGLGLAIVAAIAHMHGGQILAACEGGVTSIGFTISTIPSTGRVLS